ncbi:hypothetical protein ACSBOB_01270 [Mesorhizobium sp. ASY16-5R]|uniref:hypothetical protein n=1 Tax=Mesorhizobium sp. ASY16-5R TaxID=3445772 RepID=UPI003FA10039
MITKFVLLLPLLLADVSQGLADPLSDLLAKGNGSACFERVYDEAHLAKNPRQLTRSALLSLKAFPESDGAVVRIRFQRRDGVLYIVGGCEWTAKANLDIEGRKLIDAFKGPSGLDCHAMTSADGNSAEEGGDFPVDLRDGAAMTVYMPESLAAWRSIARSGPADWIDFGKDDNAFRVNRTDTGSCAELADKLPWWE